MKRSSDIYSLNWIPFRQFIDRKCEGERWAGDGGGQFSIIAMKTSFHFTTFLQKKCEKSKVEKCKWKIDCLFAFVQWILIHLLFSRTLQIIAILLLLLLFSHPISFGAKSNICISTSFSAIPHILSGLVASPIHTHPFRSHILIRSPLFHYAVSANAHLVMLLVSLVPSCNTASSALPLLPLMFLPMLLPLLHALPWRGLMVAGCGVARLGITCLLIHDTNIYICLFGSTLDTSFYIFAFFSSLFFILCIMNFFHSLIFFIFF